MKKIIHYLKIKYYEYIIKRLHKSVMFYTCMLESQSTLMVDRPRYKSYKKSSESKLIEITDKLLKLRREDQI